MGSFSDANTLSNFISCANLSAGYHSPHSTHEYVNLADLLVAGVYTEDIVNTLGSKKCEAPKTKVTPPYDYRRTGYYGHGGAWDDYDYEGGYWKGYKPTPSTNPISSTIEKKKKVKPTKKPDDGKLSYLGSCECCNRYTTIYRLKKTGLDMCGECLTEAFNEIVEIDTLRDPLNSGESLGY
jgi:hypothetical protein